MSDEFDLFQDEDDKEIILDEPTMTLPAVGGVRITGATPASEDPLADWQLSEAEVTSAPEVEMPHWTDQPTGQIPAVLDRDESSTAGDPLSSVSAPTWREDAGDWGNDADAFDSLLAAPVEGLVGALSSDHAIEESQPWEFDLEDLPAGTSAANEPEEELFADLDTPVAPQVDPWDLETLPPAAPVMPPSAPRRRGGKPLRPERPARPRVDERRADRERPMDRPEHRDSEGREEGRTGRDLPMAVITGIVIAVLVLVTFDIGTFLALILVIAVVTLAAAEVFAAFRRAGHQPATLLGLVAIIALMIATYNKGTQAIGLVTVLLFVFTVIWYMVGVEKTDTLRGISATMLIYVWIGIFGSYAALLLNPNLFPDRHGLAYLLGAILATVAYDVAALFIGSAIGRRPLVPEISPHKTWEGLMGGTVAAILVGIIIVPLIHPWTLSSGFALGVVVAVVAPLGDLSESLVKRSLGMKDMGRLLPGHGGMLDRVDGLLFVLPATFYLVQAFHLS
jgi:phosphatidate cytidylyltransferase